MTLNKLLQKIILFLVLLLPCAIQAQETSGSLSGTVKDAAGQALPGVTITAVHQPSGTRYAVAANKDGHYYLSNMRIGGPYSVEATMVSMNPSKKEDVTVRLGAAEQLDFVLTDNAKQLGEVVVKASKKGAQASTYGAGKNINAAQVRNMPSVSRSITDITRLVPQASKDNSFGGSNFRYNNVTIDGAINNDAIGFSPSLGGQSGTSGMAGSSTRTNPISLDAIEDMQVYLAPYDVKIGNFTGGSVNAVTRSGTNAFSGSVYGFGRNAALTGNDRVGTLGKMNSDFYDYQTGFRVGFPIIKNKLFFFSNEEVTRRQDPVQLMAGQAETSQILSVADAEAISKASPFNAGTAGAFNTYSRSTKFFNRLDWNIDDRNQLAIRNNTILSKATSMDRDQQDFRFSSMAYLQKNNQSSTVAELKSRLTNNLSGNVLVGYTMVNDSRDPLSDPSLPQIQIMGRTPGTTIYLGTDREASIFDMKQRTLELTANLNWNVGKHRFTVGTHNELYNITYGFVNAWNGRVDYNSIEDYLNNNPYRVRGAYNYTNNNRDYILNNPGAKFNVNMYSVYLQDEITISDKFKVIPGLRADMTDLPDLPELSDKTRTAMDDPFFGTTYTYTPLKKINNKFLNKVQLSPRVGFRYDWFGDQSLIIRGGTGLFTGRIPMAWLAYAYYNTGNSYGGFDQKADQKPFVAGSNPLKGGATGIAGFIRDNGTVTDNPNSGKTQVDLIDNGFVMPQVLRTSLAADYTTTDQWKFTVEAIYTKNIKDVLFQQLNVQDNPTYYPYDKNRQQPIYSGTVDQRFSNTYLLSNTSQGYRYSLTGSISKTIASVLQASVSYTYGQSKDLSNGVRNSMESNWQLNQSLVPNNPTLANSNFDIRHRIVSSISYSKVWAKAGRSNVSLFFSAQSGSPFTYGIVNNSVQGLPQQVSLAYIPQRNEAISFFQDNAAGSAIEQAAAFNNYIDKDGYLSSRRGQFTERNKGRTPWNIQADLHLSHDIYLQEDSKSFVTITADVMNLTNLINKSWGIQYFSPNTFNSTSSVGLTPVLFPPKQNPGGYPLYQFNTPGKPYSIDYYGSRTQVQLSLRYTF
ncbi:Carboxypeptidase regulatory-like domain-containing protein [Mucilaginibacter pineti]|uniref:Carboxypeptidase regulatory-like domain-containing protein n=1 Tax=Mucilaginibacter pineti TaxID=1391627 RepID=A0A1G7M2Q9_9SPHI|nr:TonB-dependent receptor [Mucilaginibacter pineti]SDF55921.1 Carboxypeptidase regulatory-like domain-containing protein [Mucilaginibacter pineti]